MTDEHLTAHVRNALIDTRGIREVKMFGGVGFMFNGNLLAAASKRGLLVRVGKDHQSEALKKPNARLMVMKGRSMHGYIRVTDEGLNARSVKAWIKMALEFVATLPPKGSREKAAAKKSVGRERSGKSE